MPITADEFIQAGRHYPVVFSQGSNPLPLALMGLNEGVNTFFDDDGKLIDPVYVPAYIRRYPFILARLNDQGDNLSLCFDPTSDSVGEYDEGELLFNEDGSTTDQTKSILDFCEKFEQAGQRTKMLTDELLKHDLLMDGEVAIHRGEDPDRPYLYKGFKMVDQAKLAEVDGETLVRWNKDGILAIIYAHLTSLELMRTIFGRQEMQGKMPPPQQQQQPAS